MSVVAADRRILVVEDELPLLEIVAEKLQLRGWQTISSRTVEEAWRFLQEIKRVDAVWMDHYLPGRLGLDLLKAIRRKSEYRDIPVILVTNAVEPIIVNQYIKEGVTKYYTKVMTSIDQIATELDLYLQLGPGATEGLPMQ